MASPMLTGMYDDDMPYELLAAASTGADTAVHVMGRYRTYEEALRARDDDVLSQLAARDGWYALIEHVIVGPGLRGTRTAHRHTTALGVDPAAGRIPQAEDLDDARHWLAALRETKPRRSPT